MSQQRPQDEQAFERSQSLGHEVRDANFRGVALAGLGLLVLTAASMAFIYWFALEFAGSPYDQPPPTAPGATPMHREPFQANQHVLRERQEAVRREILEQYTWIDKDEVARIPIDRAMAILAESDDLSVQSNSTSNSDMSDDVQNESEDKDEANVETTDNP